MKVLIFSPCSFLNPHEGVLLDYAEEYLRNGHEVSFLLCDKSVRYCFMNPYGRLATCMSCTAQHKFLLKKLSKKVTSRFIGEFKTGNSAKFHYSSADDVSSLYYDEADMGMAAMSTYITLTRNLNPKVDNDFRQLMDRFLQTGVLIYDALSALVKEGKPDRICYFNGRLIEGRPVMRVAAKYDIETYSYEAVEISPLNYKSMYYVNVLPHSIEDNTAKVNDLWEDSSVSMAEKKRIAEDYFIKKRQGMAVADKSYTASQRAGFLPEGWDSTKTNIVIFNSSEDEFASIGDDFNEKLFTTQAEAIKTILENTENNKSFHFYLRIHPNLAGIHYKYHTQLLNFDNYSNCTVIKGESKISSYTLLDNSSKIIVFGSTIGVEACFWKKPVILLGASLYKNLDVAYYPSTVRECLDLIISDIEPKKPLGALKYAYFLMNAGVPYKYIDFNARKINLFVKSMNLYNYQTIWGSQILYMLIFALPAKVINAIGNIFKKQQLPVNEE